MVLVEKPIPVLLYPQNPTQVCLGSKPGLHGGMLATNHRIHGTTP